MKRKILNPRSIPARGKPYSQGFVVQARRTLFVAGQDRTYQLYSYVGRLHLENLIAQLRFVEGAP